MNAILISSVGGLTGMFNVSPDELLLEEHELFDLELVLAFYS